MPIPKLHSSKLFSGLAAMAVSLAAQPASADPASFRPFAGAFHSPSTEHDRSVIDHAIDEGTSSMGVVRRTVGRSRLRAVNPAIATLRIELNDPTLVTDYDGLRYKAPLDGRVEIGRDPDGKPVKVSYRVEGRTLHAHYTTDEGVKDMDFTLSPDGSKLALAVTVLSDQLPRPIRYDLTFVRDD